MANGAQRQRATRNAHFSKRPEAPSLRRTVIHAVATKYNASAPMNTFVIWPGTANPRYMANSAVTTIEVTNTVPALR